jgi:hypothetical protein
MAIEHHHSLDIDPDSAAAVLFGAEQIARSGAVVAELYAGLEHPFNAMGMDALGIEFFLDQQLSLSGDKVLQSTSPTHRHCPMRRCWHPADAGR